MFHFSTILLMALLVVMMVAIAAESNNNKPIRSQQRHATSIITPKIGARGASSTGRSASIDTKESRKSGSISDPLFSLKSAATAIKDEMTDIFESIVYAESASERLENTLDVIRRHKLLISASAVAIVMKSTMGGKG